MNISFALNTKSNHITLTGVDDLEAGDVFSFPGEPAYMYIMTDQLPVHICLYDGMIYEDFDDDIETVYVYNEDFLYS